MKIIAGLGNPGPRYELTRHNAGFLAVDRLVERFRAQGPAESHDGEVYQATTPGGGKLLLVKPQTFMNNSGECVAALARFYKCAPEDVIVIHDELDLPALSFKLKTGGGNGGHNGLRSIDSHLGSAAYHRVRIGIGHPQRMLPPLRISPVDYVLQPFNDEELKELDPLLDQVARACEKIVAGDMRGAMTEFNGKPKSGSKEGEG